MKTELESLMLEWKLTAEALGKFQLDVLEKRDG